MSDSDSDPHICLLKRSGRVGGGTSVFVFSSTLREEGWHAMILRCWRIEKHALLPQAELSVATFGVSVSNLEEAVGDARKMKPSCA